MTMSTYKSLSKVYNKSKIIPYNNQSKFVIMSDCHRGAGNLGDNFLKNQHLFFAALKNYYEKGFTYIELGDGDELWENRTMEIWGVNDPTAAGKNFTKKNKVERRLMKWAEIEKKIFIAGHTHRPTFPIVGEGMYFNDGSCVHPRCITALEIEEGKITLVKWCVMTREDRSMYVERVVLEGPEKIEDYFELNNDNAKAET